VIAILVSAMRKVTLMAAELVRLLWFTMREIFDENSYARFLARSGQRSSRAAYAEFMRQESDGRERRARCC